MMEALGTIYEEQWNNITSEEADFMAQLLGNFTTPNEDEAPISDPNFLVSSAFCPSHEPNLYSVDRSTFCSSGDQINNISFRFPALGQESWHRPPSNASRRFLVNSDNFELSGDKLSEEASYEKLIREYDAGGSMEKSKKRQRIPNEFQRTKKSMKTCGKLEDHKTNNTYSSHCSGDDSNASPDQNGVAWISTSKGCEDMNLPKKKRAGRGSATDPQSLYARKRREKINERLRILQNLVPNGTKVDISTMLEEAVQYVKFLHLQIKLLSSDDMWMYAPIAYNGMDLGLDLKISTPKPEP